MLYIILFKIENDVLFLLFVKGSNYCGLYNIQCVVANL